MLRPIQIALCALVVVTLGCTQSFKPVTSTETGNPPVTIDSDKIALVVSSDEVHVVGEPGAITPPEADVEVTILRTQDVVRDDVEPDGSFDVRVNATLNDVFEVRAVIGDDRSAAVIVVRGGAEVVNPDGGMGGLGCDQRTDLANATIDEVVMTADRSCMTADDCHPYYRQSSCFSGCFDGYVSSAGLSALEATEAAIDDGVCADFRSDGCSYPIPSCVMQQPAACIEGQCAEAAPTPCEECITTELSWRALHPGILPAEVSPTVYTLHDCDVLDTLLIDGSMCSYPVTQCGGPEAAGGSIEQVLAALALPGVQQAFMDGGTHGAPDESSGFVWELTLGGNTITFQSCAGMAAGVSCDPHDLESLIGALTTLTANYSCPGGQPAEPDCTSNFDGGDCDAAIPVYWHDPQTGLCVPTIYGGCGGNGNNYASLEACEAACPPPDAMTSCPPNRVLVEDVCQECGPVGGCSKQGPACMLVCSEDEHCAGEHSPLGGGLSCQEGVCAVQVICI